MKRTWMIVAVVVCVVISVITGASYAWNKNHVALNGIKYTSQVLEKQPFYIQFKQKVSNERLTDGSLQIVEKNGNEQGKFRLYSPHIVAVDNLTVGHYELVVRENGTTTSYHFEVFSQEETVKSKTELTRYFAAMREQKETLTPMQQAPMFVIEEKADSAQDNGANSAASGDSASTTNNQVAGIDEGDIVVTDGRAIYQLRNNEVLITTTGTMQKASTIPLTSTQYPTKLMVQDGMLVVFYDAYHEQQSYANLAVYDVTNITTPKKLYDVGQNGYMTGARLMNGVVYLISNYAVYDEQSIVPTIYDEGDIREIAYENMRIFPATPSEEYTMIATVDLTTGHFESTAFLGVGQGMYMSQDAIYLTAVNYEPLPIEETTSSLDSKVAVDSAMPMWNVHDTSIYKYERSTQGTIERVAETTVKGTILNQFSMDEHNGYFRVATTAGTASLQNANSTNQLFIFDDQLQQVGALENIAPGERIYAARFMGDKVYIVTFKETDPLFVIDTQNPAQPTVLGELKIPGFSNYLHPISDTHLLGIGYDTQLKSDGKSQWIERLGIKLSLFNVADVNHPVEQDVAMLGGQGTYSAVQDDHHALYRDVTNHVYGFAASVYDGAQYIGSGSMLYTVTEQGIDEAANWLVKEHSNEQWDDTTIRIVYAERYIYEIKHQQIKQYDRTTYEQVGELTL